MEDRVNTSHCPLVTGNTDLILFNFLIVYMEIMELLPNPAESVWCKRYSYRNVLFAIPLRELADSQLRVLAATSGLTTAFCPKRAFPALGLLPATGRAQRGQQRWTSLTQHGAPLTSNLHLEHPNNLVQPLQSEAPRQGRSLRPSCSPAPEVKPTVQMEGSTCLTPGPLLYFKDSPLQSLTSLL